jgi:predicted TIM-barrel fold metal-dependent hydrolase
VEARGMGIPGRRAFLAGIAATGAGVALGRASSALAQSSVAGTRIDVHRHLSPPGYADASHAYLPVFPKPLASWTPEASIADMDASGIRFAMLSMPATPGIAFGDVAATRALARTSNEYMASLRRQYPGRYGFFAVLPLPDVAGSLREIAYALDVMKAEGIGLLSSYSDKFLGDPAFAPIWQELDRRKALVFTHPAGNDCCKHIQPEFSESVIEYGTDTTRTIASLVFSGTSSRYPNVRVIFSHGGGTMPFLIERFKLAAREPSIAKNLPNGVEAELRRYYYDTAFITNPEAMGALTKLVPASQILFGTDFPYRPAAPAVTELADCGLTSAEQLAITRQNPLAFLKV